MAGRRGPQLGYALAGAATAAAAALLSYRLRMLAIQKSRRAGTLAAVAEDGLTLGAGARLVAGA